MVIRKTKIEQKEPERLIIRKEWFMNDDGSFIIGDDYSSYKFSLDEIGFYVVKPKLTDDWLFERKLKKLQSRFNNTLYKFYDESYNLFNKGKLDERLLKEWIKEPLCRNLAYSCLIDSLCERKDIYLENEYWEYFSKEQLEELINVSIEKEKVLLSTTLIGIYSEKYGKIEEIKLD